MKRLKQTSRIIVCHVFFLGAAMAGDPPFVITEAELAANFKAEHIRGQMLHVATNGVTVVPAGRFLRDFALLTNTPVVRLYARDRGIETLEGMGVLEKLQMLDLSGNNIRDLSPLGKLPLISVNLAGNPVRDISPVLNPSLRELYLSGTEVDDLACLANTSLERLEIGTAPAMRSFSALTKLPLKRLGFLQRPQMQLKDIASLRLESYGQTAAYAANSLNPYTAVKPVLKEKLANIEKLLIKKLLKEGCE
jgi:Leucine-rich repeat (LRR) protein